MAGIRTNNKAEKKWPRGGPWAFSETIPIGGVAMTRHAMLPLLLRELKNYTKLPLRAAIGYSNLELPLDGHKRPFRIVSISWSEEEVAVSLEIPLPNDPEHFYAITVWYNKNGTVEVC